LDVGESGEKEGKEMKAPRWRIEDVVKRGVEDVQVQLK
jgi:hypothetical protein